MCFSDRSKKKTIDGRPGLWLAETLFTCPLKLLNGIQQNVTGSKISTSSTKFVFFESIGKTRWPSWLLIGWDIFEFSFETAEQNSTKLYRKQDLNILYKICEFVFSGRSETQDGRSAFNETWQEGRSQHPSPCKFVFFGPFGKTRLPPWLQWNLTGRKISTSFTKFVSLCFSGRSETQDGRSGFNETWQEGRSQHPPPSLCFSGRSEKQDCRPDLCLTETFSTSPLKPLNGIRQNWTGSKISTSTIKLVFLGSNGKTRWPSWPLIGWDISDFSSKTAERNSTILDRKQDLNIFYQVCVFQADE